MHFSAVNPVEIKKALIEAGHKNIKSEYYQFDPKVFDPKNTTVFLYDRIYDKDRMNKKNFVSYNPEEMEKYSLNPQETKEYYKIMIDEGKNPMLYYRIPHILYKGVLDITGLTKVYI